MIGYINSTIIKKVKELSPKTYKIKSESLGEIEFRYILVKDLEFFIKLLNKVKNDREFVINVLHHQTISPKISVSEFSKIPDSKLIEIAQEFLKYEPEVFRYFKENNNKDFFAEFKKAIEELYKESILPITKIGESIRKIREQLKTFSSVLFCTDLFKSLSLINKQFKKPYLEHLNFLKKISDSFSPIFQFSKFLSPQIEFWKKWTEINKKIFTPYENFWKVFREKYEEAEKEVVSILKKYKWLISPNMPLSFIFEVVKISKKQGNQRSAINKLFVNYFSVNNFKNLEELINKWENNSFFKPRMKIFKDCLGVIKHAKKKYNPSNVVLPVLIAQIDGIRLEFMNRNGLSFRIRDEDWKEFFKNQIPEHPLLELANWIFIDILFQKAFPGQPLKTPFIFNRHKIMHGETLRYGRIDNVIRTFLILDFLANITGEKKYIYPQIF